MSHFAVNSAMRAALVSNGLLPVNDLAWARTRQGLVDQVRRSMERMGVTVAEAEAERKGRLFE
jgi:hypothetical protein